ncbi:GDYXXLXY domain-containing protein [Allohahella marinimesophila]|uniref:GDYXXLXY domain-containing protein n=1 Tax=Allohahella marinimesophila TaxID=1054972 RepID=A0ABP7P8H8_9GAMM
MARHLVVLVLVGILAGFNWAVVEKERILNEGKVLYLELAPVDPRSLMQGDYMALRFAIENDIRQALAQTDEMPQAADGSLIVRLDDRQVASFHRLQDFVPDVVGDSAVTTRADEVQLQYRIRRGQVEFATDAFFFQEGQDTPYEAARYGQFRLGEDGTLILTGLHGTELEHLQPPQP